MRPLQPSDNADELIRAGKDAEQLLENELFRDACLVVEENIIREWRAGRTPEIREAAHAKLVGLTAVLATLKQVMERGRTELDLRPKVEPASKTDGG